MDQVGLQFESDDAMRHAQQALKTLPPLGVMQAYTREDLARWVHTAATGDRDATPRGGRPTTPDPVIWILPFGDTGDTAEGLRNRRPEWDIDTEGARVFVANPCTL